MSVIVTPEEGNAAAVDTRIASPVLAVCGYELVTRDFLNVAAGTVRICLNNPRRTAIGFLSGQVHR